MYQDSFNRRRLFWDITYTYYLFQIVDRNVFQETISNIFLVTCPGNKCLEYPWVKWKTVTGMSIMEGITPRGTIRYSSEA